ncbi:unnamed protein product [Blepharisma stoltei]|uniref:Ubiquitin-like domain-containing protein n=1 Tax=Blepharisma stoltei TaxID=1481888 RepID=A0AAU9J939_9CILI|nr:unnamed protein product [Blepharisma stoltei]
MGNCLKVLTKKTQGPTTKAEKVKKLSLKDTHQLDASNVEILHADGNTSAYICKYEKNEEVNANELLIMYFEGFDGRKEEVQIVAGERVSTLRTKAKAIMGLDDIHMVLDGKVLEDKFLLNQYKVSQGAVIDVIPVYSP